MSTSREILDGVDADRLRRDLFAVASDPLPRRTVACTLPGHSSHTLDETDSWIEEQMAECGLSVTREAFQVQAYGCDETKPLHHWYAAPPPGAPLHTVYNLTVEIPGDHARDGILLLMAHKDSQSWIACPGALDNGAGLVALVEIARAMARRGARRTVRFLFCNEEHTPWTSEPVANAMRCRGDDLRAAINLDALTGKSDEDRIAGRKTAVTVYTRPEGRRIVDLMEAVNERWRIGLEHRGHLRDFPNDDDGSFIKAGYPFAVASFGSFPYADAEYHLPGDTPERVDFDNLRMAAQLNLGAILALDEE